MEGCKTKITIYDKGKIYEDWYTERNGGLETISYD